MKTGYLWPVYGERDEVCFPFFPSREAACVYETLGMKHRPGTVLLSDGYAAYAQYVKRAGLVHAQCWAHARRELFEAQQMDPEAAQSALLQIQGIYQIEEDIRAQRLKGENKRLHRLTHSKPRVERFFEWIDQQFARQGLLPSNPFVKALAYARDRREGLEAFLTDPEVPLDTNHVERNSCLVPSPTHYLSVARRDRFLGLVKRRGPPAFLPMMAARMSAKATKRTP